MGNLPPAQSLSQADQVAILQGTGATSRVVLGTVAQITNAVVGVAPQGIVYSNGTTESAAVVGSGLVLNGPTITTTGATGIVGALSIPTTAISAGTIVLTPSWPWQSGTITSVCGIASAASGYTLGATINGTTITNCGSIVISGATLTSANAGGANTLTVGGSLAVVVSGITGSPTGEIQVTFTHSQP